MVRLSIVWLIAFMLALPATQPSHALQSSEILEDPVLEARAREVSAKLRCLVCQNQSIDDSNAGLARDLRTLVRERILAGDTNRQVIDHVVDRYGDFVLLSPPFKMQTALLWAAPLILLVLGSGLAVAVFRRTQVASVAETVSELSDDEQRKLDALLNDEKKPD